MSDEVPLLSQLPNIFTAYLWRTVVFSVAVKLFNTYAMEPALELIGLNANAVLAIDLIFLIVGLLFANYLALRMALLQSYDNHRLVLMGNKQPADLEPKQ